MTHRGIVTYHRSSLPKPCNERILVLELRLAPPTDGVDGIYTSQATVGRRLLDELLDGVDRALVLASGMKTRLRDRLYFRSGDSLARTVLRSMFSSSCKVFSSAVAIFAALCVCFFAGRGVACKAVAQESEIGCLAPQWFCCKGLARREKRCAGLY